MMAHQYSEKVLILDFGSQYTQLIARRVREAHVYCEIFPYNMSSSDIVAFNPKAIILSGGPDSVGSESILKPAQLVFELAIPVLGICYGMQIMASQLGGEVMATNLREYGYAKVHLNEPTRLFCTVADSGDNDGFGFIDVWMSHGDQVTKLPDGFRCIASSANAKIAGMADERRALYGVQFHPEVTHTPKGETIFKHFLYDIAGCKGQWTTDFILTHSIDNIRQQVGDDHVLLALSGGVDSSVLATLLHRAIGAQLHCVFVDNGLLRHREAELLMEIFSTKMGMNVHHVDARSLFLNALKGIFDPEQKRKIIGREFIRVFERQSCQFTDIKWLAQGTIYPDVIESAITKHSQTALIKSHHNVGGLPENMVLSLIEPLRELFKDEVRHIGHALGLCKQIINRHPFPGPGLAVRIMGEIKEEYLSLLRHADQIFIDALKKEGWYEKVAQAFVVFLPIRSVGVMGDERRHDYVVCLRAVESVDFMTANWAHLPHAFLAKVAHRIINEVDGISRVTYDISNKPPATIEWE